MAHGSAAAAGQIKIRTVTETDGVSQIGGHRPGRHIPLSLIGNRYNHYQRHIPLSLIGNRYNHYQRQIEVVQNSVSVQSEKAAGFSPIKRKTRRRCSSYPIRAWVRLYDSPSNLIILP